MEELIFESSQSLKEWMDSLHKTVWITLSSELSTIISSRASMEKYLDGKSGNKHLDDSVKAYYACAIERTKNTILGFILILDGEKIELKSEDFYQFYKKNKNKKKISLKPKKLSGSRNRVAGHNWERECAVRMREELGFTDCVTSRSCSRNRDNAKVDLTNAHEGIDWNLEDSKDTPRLPYNIQCKIVKGRVDYPKLISELEEHNGKNRTNVIFHKSVEKDSNGNFQPVGEYAILTLAHFQDMMSKIAESDPEMKYHRKYDEPGK